MKPSHPTLETSRSVWRNHLLNPPTKNQLFSPACFPNFAKKCMWFKTFADLLSFTCFFSLPLVPPLKWNERLRSWPHKWSSKRFSHYGRRKTSHEARRKRNLCCNKGEIFFVAVDVIGQKVSFHAETLQWWNECLEAKPSLGRAMQVPGSADISTQSHHRNAPNKILQLPVLLFPRIPNALKGQNKFQQNPHTLNQSFRKKGANKMVSRFQCQVTRCSWSRQLPLQGTQNQVMKVGTDQRIRCPTTSKYYIISNEQQKQHNIVLLDKYKGKDQAHLVSKKTKYA